MSRTQYENTETLAKEKAFANDLEMYWGKQLIKMHYYNRLDFAMVERDSKDIKYWVEVKCLNRNKAQYPNFMLSTGKWFAGLEYYEKTGLPFIFAVRCDDGDYFYQYGNKNSADYNYQYKGRTRTQRDEQDVEPCVMIPQIEFEFLGRGIV